MSYDQDRRSPLPRLSRRTFLGGLTASATAAFLAACGSTASTPAPGGGGGASAAPAASAAASTAPAAAGTKKDLIFWGREQFLPESNDYLRESVQMAAQKGNFNVRIELFTNDEHAQKEVVAFESGILPDITYTYAPARWNSSGKALEVGALFDEVGKTGGGWLDLADPASKMDGTRISIPMNNEPWFLHLRKDRFEAAGVKLPVDSWEALLEAFQKVNKPDQNQYAFDGQMTEADWTGNCLQFMWMFGGRLFDKDGNPTVDTPANLKGVTAYTDLLKNKLMPPGVVQQQASGNNEAWLSGQASAVSNPGSIVLAMRKDNQDLLNKTYLQAFPLSGSTGKYVQLAGSASLVINKGTSAVQECGEIAKTILSPDRYPTQLEKAGSYWFPIMKNYLTGKFFTDDQWNKQVVENIVPYTLPANADTGLTPILDDITVSATKDMLQAIVVQNKTPQEGLKILAEAAAKAKEKFKK
jgi:ABC-type glycerol-3-phosphate transport system substrate-binding protein